jgi:hypothetical protein
MTREYSEDNLIEQTGIDLFFHQLGWDTLLAYKKEGFGEGSTLGRLNKKEVDTLPYPTYQLDDIDRRTTLVYDHLKHPYFGGGINTYR